MQAIPQQKCIMLFFTVLMIFTFNVVILGQLSMSMHNQPSVSNNESMHSDNIHHPTVISMTSPNMDSIRIDQFRPNTEQHPPTYRPFIANAYSQVVSSYSPVVISQTSSQPRLIAASPSAIGYVFCWNRSLIKKFMAKWLWFVFKYEGIWRLFLVQHGNYHRLNLVKMRLNHHIKNQHSANLHHLHMLSNHHPAISNLWWICLTAPWTVSLC